MRLAEIVFTGAGVWGIVALTPLYWLVDLTGRQYSPPTDHPHFFYGFLSVAMAWQAMSCRVTAHRVGRDAYERSSLHAVPSAPDLRATGSGAGAGRRHLQTGGYTNRTLAHDSDASRHRI